MCEMDLSPSTKFIDVDLKITDIHYHPKEVLVKFQGSYNTDHEFDYHILQNEIQQVSKVKDCIGIGEFCLVEDPNCGEWYRGRVIRKKNHIYEVFLIDNGNTLAVRDSCIASAVDELFQLPPKMVCGIFANILPVGEKWSSKALNYFSSLIDLQIKGRVQAIMPHQTFLLDVPKVTSDVIELKLGKCVDGDTFHLIVEMLAELPEEPLCNQMPDLIQKKYTRQDSVFCNAMIQQDFQPIFDRLRPLLSVGGVQQVKISVAVSPSKFYCQPVQYLMELDELTNNMSSYYETINRENIPSFDSLGVLCAARRKDGHWYRGVIQQLLSDNNVKVWFVDIGNCEAVPSSCVLKLESKFISVPRFSFPCALSCLSDQDKSIRNSQLKEFKEALLRQSLVYIHIDLFDANEHLYYVTLLKHESTTNGEYLPQGNAVVPSYGPSFKTEITDTYGDVRISNANPVFAEPVPNNILQSRNCSNAKGSSSNCVLSVPYETAEMKTGSVYVAFVEYVLNPSNFWVQTNHLDEFEALMGKVSDVYDIGETGDKNLENPEPGMLCCARYNKDMHFYRAVIEEVCDSGINVYFLDFGNTETVPMFEVRTLLPEFQELPALAICCSLARAFPVEDVWIKKETDFFKNLVFGKPVILHVVGKQNNKYSVSMQCVDGSVQVDVLQSMVQAGYAVCWEVKPDPLLYTVKDCKEQNPELKSKNMQCKNHMWNNKMGVCRNVNNLPSTHPVTMKVAVNCPRWESTLSKKYGKVSGESNSMCPYKEYRFKPGTVLAVICCDSTSPGDFSCQVQTKLPELNNLMEQIQIHYKTQTMPYQSGQLACVVKDSNDGKWYRACVVKHVSKTRIEVVLVDYGNQKNVLLENIQAILPDFLTLECQAFRCCLSSVTRSLKFDPGNWTAEACNDFKSFISSSNGLLTCTISALIIKSPSCLYNVVDLWTPHVRAQQFLLDCGHDQFCSLQFPRLLAPSFFLYSFYYSSFDVNVGNEEDVCITHIKSPTKFYCQLNRNADDMGNLLQKITDISKMASCVGQIDSRRLYLAKYFEDGFFYRALAFPVGLSDYLPVYFVDFGNKQVVAKDELIHIPDHASEVLFTPMQAVKCYLLDLKDTEIPVEINKWFEKNFLGKELKAVIIAKESDGQLGVELYDNHLQISKKIKELLLKHTAKCNEPPKYVNRYVEKPLGAQNVKGVEKMSAVIAKVKRDTENKINSYRNDGEVYAEPGKETAVDLQEQCSRSVEVPVTYENTESVLQNTLGERDKSTSKEISDDTTLKCKKVPANDMTELHIQELNPSGQERSTSAKQKYRDLIQCNIQPNSKVMGYVSFIISPSSFYFHLEEAENKILLLSEELNRCRLILEPQTDIEEGDIVLTEYEVDGCIYRAVVRAVKSDAFYEVEFIDYGNSSSVNASKIYKIEKAFLNLPRLSIHCFISQAKCMLPDKNWSSNITAYFVSKLNNQQIICKFLHQHGEQWEVELFSRGKSVIDDLMQMKICLDLQNMPMLNERKLLSAINTYSNVNDQSHQIVHKEYESGPTWKSLPKIAYQKFNPGQLEIAEIGHISRNGNFYVKLTKDAQTLHIVDMMATQEAEQILIAVEDIQEGLECLAKSKITSKWHRSEVIKKFVNEENVLGFFIDLGIYEMVSFNDIRRLSSKMRHIPRNAVPCKWVWIGNTDGLAFERVLKMLKGHEIKILFMGYLESALIWQVEILVNGILLLEYWPQISNQGKLEKCNLLEKENLNNMKMTVPEYSFRQSSISWAKFQNNRSYPGFVTSVTDPSNFFIQLEDSFKTMEVLFKLLSDLPENLPTMPRELVGTGTSCLIKTEPNKKWNRVEVSQLSNQYMLTFVDDGVSASIPISDFHRLKVIPEALVHLPRLTYPCSLFGVSPILREHWNDEAKCKIQQFLGRQGLIFQFRQYCGMKMEVDVSCEESNAADVLVASGCAVYSFTSTNFVECNALSSQTLHSPLQMGSQKSSGKAGDHKISDLLFKYTCDTRPRRSSSKKLCCRKKLLKKVASHIKRNKNKTFSGQCHHKKELRKTSPIGISARITHEIPDPTELSTFLEVMKISEEKPSNKHCARKVSFKCLIKINFVLLIHIENFIKQPFYEAFDSVRFAKQHGLWLKFS
ncbi:tudor domain-containing protein 15 [Eublepharis macularius]|uniref:Tudor domain-containing protein 15 n=1 Tax=Eublepharis macularius TaxID=481883 RepID=A0AA97IWS3_EUBMA|nr:tudor domain-containing protein 15 [Eublepharis macularius]